MIKFIIITILLSCCVFAADCDDVCAKYNSTSTVKGQDTVGIYDCYCKCDDRFKWDMKRNSAGMPFGPMNCGWQNPGDPPLSEAQMERMACGQAEFICIKDTPVPMQVTRIGAGAPGPASTQNTCTINTTPVNWADVKKKLNSRESTISMEEFIVYLEKLEEANPARTWKELMTYMHHDMYPEDINREIPFTSIRLFQKGPESNGWKNVTPVSLHVPKFIKGLHNETIDIAHSYAGLRSDFNRKNGIRSWMMRNINTNWGDTYQVYSPPILGIFNLELNGFEPERAPPKQRRGNDMGLWVSSYYRENGNDNKKLSTAYQEYFFNQCDG